MLTQPLTRPLTRKIHRAQLTSIRYRDFDPLSLEPYLLFDAESSMLGNLENPTLDLDASDNGSLDVITATRAGIATFTAADGQIVTADPNTVRVDHVQGEELTPTKFQNIPNTEFDQWNKGSNTIVTANATQAPDGSMTGYQVSMNSAVGTYLRYNLTLSSPSVFTFYLKASAESIAAGTNELEVQIGGNTPVFTATEEWQRVSYIVTQSLNNDIVGFNDGSTGNTDVYLWGPQLEEGTTATDFVPNTTGSPKFIASATYGPRVPMMLIEPSATNLLSYSEDFNDNSWSKNNVSVTENAGIAPDGTETASRITVDSSNAFHSIKRLGALGAEPYSFSSYLKAGTATTASFFLTQSGNNGALFDLQAGTVISVSGTGNTASIEDVGSGWFRCVITNNGSSDVFDTVSIGVANGAFAAFQGNGTDSILVWGAQLEAGSVATSYIPTSGSAGVRNADNLVIDGTAFSDFYNATEGTIYTEFEYNSQPNYDYLYTIQQTSNDEIRANLIPTNTARVTYVVAGINVGYVSSNTLTKGSLNRHAFSYKTDNFRLSVNGGAEDEDLTGTASLSPTYIQFGARYGSVTMPLYFKRLIYWPTHSSNL